VYPVCCKALHVNQGTPVLTLTETHNKIPSVSHLQQEAWLTFLADMDERINKQKVICQVCQVNCDLLFHAAL